MAKINNNISTFCDKMWTEQTGGGVMVDYIEMNNGKVIGITDECVCVGNNMVDLDAGESIGVVHLLEIDRAYEKLIPNDIHKKIIALCDGDKVLAKKAIHKLLKTTTIHKMGKIIDKLK